MKSLLRISLLMLVALFVSNTSFAQDKTKRASPPMEATGKSGEAMIKVTYSAPATKGRAIWGELVPYGKIWRAGANEATTFETDKDITIDGKALAAGKYSVFLVPSEKEWTFVFNSVSDQWGAYQYDEKKDVLRVSVTPEKMKDKSELLTYKVDGEKLWLMWDDHMAAVALK